MPASCGHGAGEPAWAAIHRLRENSNETDKTDRKVTARPARRLACRPGRGSPPSGHCSHRPDGTGRAGRAGDLDPSSAISGAGPVPNLDGPLWSLDVQDTTPSCSRVAKNTAHYGCHLSDFAGRLLARRHARHGIRRGVARPDHRVRHGAAERWQGGRRGECPATRRHHRSSRCFACCRTGRSMLGFGLGGLVLVGDATSCQETGRSVLVEPDGRIVVAEAAARNLLVARLLANGALDPAFGTGGVSMSGPRDRIGRG